MSGTRVLRILEQLRPAGEGFYSRLCEVCANTVLMSGAGIMLMSEDEAALGSLCTTNDVSGLIEDLQFTLGEGPGVEACSRGRPVTEPDLADPAEIRWPAFSPPAVAVGVRAVFAFPLHLGSVRLGALNLYRDQPGPLTDEQYGDAVVLANVAAKAALGIRQNDPSGSLTASLEECGESRVTVHQASGMIAAQLGVSVREGLVLLRSHAFAHERSISDLAEDVVMRRLRFQDPALTIPQGDGRNRRSDDLHG